MILITGGAGFIGRHLATLLALLGDQQVRALSRSPERVFEGAEETLSVGLEAVERLAEAGLFDQETLAAARERAQRGEALLRDTIEPVAADIRDKGALRNAVEGVDAVVHAVAIIRETEGRSFEDTNVKATADVISAMEDVGVRRLVAMGVLGAINDPHLPYSRSRWQAEQAVVQSGLDYTLVKPSLVLGVTDSLSMRLLKALNLSPPLVVLPNGGKARFQPLFVGDLVAILALCLRRPETIGQTFEIGGPEYVTFGQLTRTFARVLSKRRIFVPVPTALLMPGTIAMSKLLKDPPATPTELRQLDVDNFTSLDAVRRHFGFDPQRLEAYVSYIQKVAAAT